MRTPHHTEGLFYIEGVANEVPSGTVQIGGINVPFSFVERFGDMMEERFDLPVIFLETSVNLN